MNSRFSVNDLIYRANKKRSDSGRKRQGSGIRRNPRQAATAYCQEPLGRAGRGIVFRGSRGEAQRPYHALFESGAIGSQRPAEHFRSGGRRLLRHGRYGAAVSRTCRTVRRRKSTSTAPGVFGYCIRTERYA
jgi:hypothetical protein